MIIKNCPCLLRDGKYNFCCADTITPISRVDDLIVGQCEDITNCLLKQIVEVNKVGKWKEHNTAEQTLKLFDIEEGGI